MGTLSGVVAIVSQLLYMLALLGIGVGARSVGVLTPPRRELLNDAAFYVALPALVFTSTHAQPLREVVSARLLAGFWLVLLAMVGLSLAVHRGVPSRRIRSVAVVQSYHCNLGFLGLPIVASTFGDLTTAKASIVLGAGALTQVPLTMALLARLNDADASLRAEARGLLANPVILALVAGIAVSWTGAPVPGAVADGLGVVAEFALPLALLCVGGALSLSSAGTARSTVGAVVALKVFAMPLVALGVFSLFGASPSTLRAGVVMVAMPTAVSTYVYATEFGGDERLASLNIFATTVVSLVVVVLALQALVGP